MESQLNSNKPRNSLSSEDITAAEKESCDNEDTYYLLFNITDPSSAFLCFKKLIKYTGVVEVPSLTMTGGKLFELGKRESESIIKEGRYKLL